MWIQRGWRSFWGGEDGSFKLSAFSVISILKLRADRDVARVGVRCSQVPTSGTWGTRYWVTVLTLSPVLNPEPETGSQIAEASSTSVAFTTPTVVARRRITAPVVGSLISLVTRSTLN